MKRIETFENVELMIFEPEKRYTLPSGLQIELGKILEGTYWRGSKGIVEPSGIMKSQSAGTKELVIGDSSDFYFFFPNGAKNLEYQYYQVENYTAEDAFQNWKEAAALTEREKMHTITAFAPQGSKPQMTPLWPPMAYAEPGWVAFHQHPFVQLAFAVGTFGNLHIGYVEWEDLS